MLPCVPQFPQQPLHHFRYQSLLSRQAKSWHPARRIGNWIHLEDITRLGFDDIDRLRLGLQQRSFRTAETESSTGERAEDGYPTYLATVFVYCPPCTCLIETAVEVCDNMPDPQLLRRLIRIDDRLPCSCFDQPVALETQQRIVENIQRLEASSLSNEEIRRTRAEYVDRDFIEKRVEELEDEVSPRIQQTPHQNLQRIFESHCYSDKVAGIVILGEHRSLSSLTQVTSFPKKARMPVENEIYAFWKTLLSSDPWRRSRIGTFATKRSRINVTTQQA